MEEWNEYGEIKENLGSPVPAASTSTPTPSSTNTPSKPTTTSTSAILPSTPTKAPLASPATPSQLSTETSAPEPITSDPAAELTNAMRQAGFEAAKKAGDAKTKARIDTLEAAKAKNPELLKLDNSGPTGMPPPSGTTEATEAAKGDSGVTTMGSKADAVPATGTEEEQARSIGEKVSDDARQGDSGGKIAESDKPSQDRGEEGDMNIPSTKEVEQSANEAIAQDETEVLEGRGQAELEISTAKAVDENANKAIKQGESEEIQEADKKGLGTPNPFGAGETEGAPTSKPDDEIPIMASSGEEPEQPSDNQNPQDTHTGPRSNSQSSNRPLNNLGDEMKIEDEGQGLHGEEKEKASIQTGQGHTSDATKEAENTASKTDSESNLIEKAEQDQPEKPYTKGVSATNEAEDLPGMRTQDQPAGSGENAGESVAD